MTCVSVLTDVNSSGENVLVEPEEYQALNDKEETDLEKMMSELRFSPGGVEEFVDKLSNQLSILDEVRNYFNFSVSVYGNFCHFWFSFAQENLLRVLSSEQKVVQLVGQLDLAIDEAANLETQLNSFDEIVGHVRSTIEKMEQKNILIRIVNKNNEKLFSQLNSVVVGYEF